MMNYENNDDNIDKMTMQMMTICEDVNMMMIDCSVLCINYLFLGIRF